MKWMYDSHMKNKEKMLAHISARIRALLYFWKGTSVHLPSYMKNLLDDKKQFKNTLKNYLLVNSFYSLKDFLTVNTNFKMWFFNV
jgi:hypothetical protein